jgi:hypothetical protein
VARPFLGDSYPRELYGSKMYRIWSDMKTRCNNPRFKQYADYGGRGICVCERWASFANFLADMGPTYRAGLSLDRVDNDGPYCPDNCRWTDKIVQANNTRRNVYHEWNGQTHTLAEWARIRGIKGSTLRQRYYGLKWPIDRCLMEGVGL